MTDSLLAEVIIEYQSRTYRGTFRSSQESLKIEGHDEAELERKALDFGQSQIGTSKAALVTVKAPKGRTLFYDGESGEKFRGAYPGNDTTCVPFRVCQVRVVKVQLIAGHNGTKNQKRDDSA